MIESFLAAILPTDLSASAKLVLIELAMKQGATHRACAVSTGFLVKSTGLSDSSVKRAIKDLLASQKITCKRKKISQDYNDINEYSVVWVNNYRRRMRWLRRERERAEAA